MQLDDFKSNTNVLFITICRDCLLILMAQFVEQQQFYIIGIITKACCKSKRYKQTQTWYEDASKNDWLGKLLLKILLVKLSEKYMLDFM